MKMSKHGNLYKVIAFVLIAIVILSTVGFVANGWQPILNPEANSGNVDNNDNDEADKNKGQNSEGNSDVPVATTQKFYNCLTGLEVSEAASKNKPIAFTVDPTKSLYGVSESPLSIEFPLEDGGTRLLIYSDTITSLGKIGAITPTRKYISNMIKFFGGALISYGSDDIINYSSIDISKDHFDLSVKSGYHYTENSTSIFTNADLVKAGLSEMQISTSIDGAQRLPFFFTDIGSEALRFNNNAKTVTIPYSVSTETKLIYDEKTGKYSYFKGNDVKIDLLNTKQLEYDNAFVLFADSVTYETSQGTQLIPSTVGAGVGYYLTGGTYKTIKWVSDNDSMTFYDENDNKLAINRGASYIAFVKSSLVNSVIFS